MSELYNHSYNELYTTITKQADGSIFNTSSIQSATYKILDCAEGTPLLTVTTDDGISKPDSDNLLTKLEAEAMTMEAGEYWHEMVITNMEGKVLPPVFSKQVTIK